MVKDSLAQIAPTETALGRPTATARRLVDASVSANTRRAYAGALSQLDAWLDGLRLAVDRWRHRRRDLWRGSDPHGGSDEIEPVPPPRAR